MIEKITKKTQFYEYLNVYSSQNKWAIEEDAELSVFLLKKKIYIYFLTPALNLISKILIEF